MYHFISWCMWRGLYGSLHMWTFGSRWCSLYVLVFYGTTSYMHGGVTQVCCPALRNKNIGSVSRGPGRPQSSADYFVFKHFPYCDHGCISRMWCSIVLLKIPMLSLFSSHLIEERIQYIINVAVRFRGFVEKWGANDSLWSYSTPQPHLFTM
jgi:hypothetical protein